MNASVNILSVDDEFCVAHALAFALSTPGRRLTLAFSGDEALAKIAEPSRHFDILIIDHKMPRMSGIDLVRRLRSENFRGKIVVLSAHLTEENRHAYTHLKVDKMLTKPFEVHELRDVIDNLAKVA